MCKLLFIALHYKRNHILGSCSLLCCLIMVPAKIAISEIALVNFWTELIWAACVTLFAS